MGAGALEPSLVYRESAAPPWTQVPEPESRAAGPPRTAIPIEFSCILMKTLGFPWKLILVFKIIPKPIRDWMYDRIALNRYHLFGKYEYCSLPTPDHDKRYLDGNSGTPAN